MNPYWTDRARALAELRNALDLLQRSAAATPLKHIAETGTGGLHIADMHIRDDGRDYNIEADFVDDLVRGAHYAIKALEAEGKLLGQWASISKGLGLSTRSAEVADYDDELASNLAATAAATLAWRENEWIAAQERQKPQGGSIGGTLGNAPPAATGPEPASTGSIQQRPAPWK